MSKKIFRAISKVATVVATVASFIPGVGQVIAAVAMAVALGSSLLAGKPKAPETSPADRERLFANIDPRTPRKIVYGHTAMATDIRDQEYSGTDKEYLHRFIVCAAHKVGSFDQIWFDDKLAWTSTGGVQGEFIGYLTVATRTEGTAANAINISSRMGSARRYTGLAYVHFTYKLTGNDKKTESPFAQSIATRLTIVGDTMPVYDPRKDDTKGGSGDHRSDDQDTWDWDDDGFRNPALQMLNYLLGWKINGKLSVGKGVPADRINMASFIAAANLCDEDVALAAGGTEPRYRTDGIFSEGDSMSLVLDQFKSSMNATLDDVDGQIRVYVLHDDLSVPAADFDENDIIGDVDWKPHTKLTEQFNIIRGSYSDASDNSLYQSISYPELEVTSEDGIDRIETIDYPLVQSASQCQRLAKQRLQRMQYGGMFRATYQATAWQVQKGDVIRQTFSPLAFSNKLFRVIDTGAQLDGVVPMLLREEHADLYLWDAEESPAVVPADPDSYDYTKNPLYLDIAAAATNVDLQSAVLQIETALALAAARGKVWTGATLPSIADSNIGDTWIAPDGVFYDRVDPVGILLAGNAIVLGGFRPVFAWTASANQPLRDTIAATTAAQVTADAAVLALSYLDDDGVLTIDEKIRRLIPEDAALEQSYTTITATAAGLSVSTSAIAAARAAWIALRDAISPAWDDTSQSSTVVRNSLDAALLTYRDEFEALRAAIEAKLDGLAEAAQNAADAAQATADAAEAGAAQANTILANIANDDVLTPGEKPEVILKRDVILDEQAGIETSADDYGITTEKTAYTDAVTALTTFLATLTTPVLWSSFAGNTTIVGTTFRTKFADVYAARQVLLNKIAAVAAVRIENIGADGILSRNEKLQLVREVAAILANHAALDAKATALGTAGTEQTAAQASIDALDAYLATLSPAWNDSSQDTAIVRATFDGNFSDVADDVAALQAAIQGIAGADGSPGLNSAALFLYRRSATTPDLPSTTSTYTFATGVLTGFNNSWSTTVPAGTDPLYITTASASGTGATDTIAAGEWASPTILARDGLIGDDGPPGNNGIDGLNNAVVFIYQRKSTEPSLPSATATYSFATGAITGLDNGWQATVPAGTDPLYVSTATASAAGTTDTIASGEWAAVTVMAQDGDKGNYIDILFYPPGPEPATPFGTSPAGWTNQPEEGGFYSRAERRASDGAIVTTWSVPVKLGAFRNRGAWNATDTYYPDDTVQYSGGTYASFTEHSNSAPSGTDQDNANWYVIAAPGAAGTPATPPGAFSDTIDLTTQTGPVNLRTLADAAGYTGMSDATITFNVPTGVTITGGTSGTGGLNGITTGTWPSGYTIALDLSVTGNVYGGGGKGGNGESGDNGGTNGLNGGDAIYALEDIDIIVNSGGQVKGGGGGGGGGKGTTTTPGGEPIFFGGGGGGGGAPNGAGGIAGYSDVAPAASDGSAGTTGGGGAGGALGNATYSSAGGNGGGFAAAGTNVAFGTNGGAAGNAIRKNGKTVNVTNNGTITGTEG